MRWKQMNFKIQDIQSSEKRPLNELVKGEPPLNLEADFWTNSSNSLLVLHFSWDTEVNFKSDFYWWIQHLKSPSKTLQLGLKRSWGMNILRKSAGVLFLHFSLRKEWALTSSSKWSQYKHWRVFKVSGGAYFSKLRKLSWDRQERYIICFRQRPLPYNCKGERISAEERAARYYTASIFSRT